TKDTGAALFNNPTSSSNSEANTDEGNLREAAFKRKERNITPSSEASLRCCR
uniref:Uncharacterized protein n=1 Tax=Erpetoichthys calabaricus TaxID=27687 RepID=A0A8C4X489_ERPCA